MPKFQYFMRPFLLFSGEIFSDDEDSGPIQWINSDCHQSIEEIFINTWDDGESNGEYSISTEASEALSTSLYSTLSLSYSAQFDQIC